MTIQLWWQRVRNGASLWNHAQRFTGRAGAHGLFILLQACWMLMLSTGLFAGTRSPLLSLGAALPATVLAAPDVGVRAHWTGTTHSVSPARYEPPQYEAGWWDVPILGRRGSHPRFPGLRCLCVPASHVSIQSHSSHIDG